jgi:hypothetical protein
LLIPVLFLTSSCSTVKKLDIFKQEVPRQPLNLELPDPLKVQELKWYIINSENSAEVLEKVKASGADPVLFGLTDEGYETLTINFAQIRAYIIKQREIIEQYKEYYESEDALKKK